MVADDAPGRVDHHFSPTRPAAPRGAAGLRPTPQAGELRTLTVARLDLTPGAECVRLEAAREKNREGSTLPLRTDLAADLRRWVAEKDLAPADRVFTVPTGLRRILDRDMRAAGIPKRDERGRTVDVHPRRTTFATLLSASGVAPRTAQAAMRHSDINLTMGTYTDPKLLDVRQAVERLPAPPGRRARKVTTIVRGRVTRRDNFSHRGSRWDP